MIYMMQYLLKATTVNNGKLGKQGRVPYDTASIKAVHRYSNTTVDHRHLADIPSPLEDG